VAEPRGGRVLDLGAEVFDSLAGVSPGKRRRAAVPLDVDDLRHQGGRAIQPTRSGLTPIWARSSFSMMTFRARMAPASDGRRGGMAVGAMATTQGIGSLRVWWPPSMMRRATR